MLNVDPLEITLPVELLFVSEKSRIYALLVESRGFVLELSVSALTETDTSELTCTALLSIAPLLLALVASRFGVLLLAVLAVLAFDALLLAALVVSLFGVLLLAVLAVSVFSVLLLAALVVSLFGVLLLAVLVVSLFGVLLLAVLTVLAFDALLLVTLVVSLFGALLISPLVVLSASNLFDVLTTATSADTGRLVTSIPNPSENNEIPITAQFLPHLYNL